MNVAKKALEVYDHLVKNGFNEVRVLTSSKECTWHCQYAVFDIQFDIPYSSNYSTRSRYEVNEFDHDQFEQDLITYMQEQFLGCAVGYNRTTHEFEIQGPECDLFFEQYSEELEKIAEKSGHMIYESN